MNLFDWLSVSSSSLAATGNGLPVNRVCRGQDHISDSACERTRSAPADLSWVATIAQDGRVFHAGGPHGSVNASSAMGRCVAAITAVCSAGRSAATTSRNFAGSTPS